MLNNESSPSSCQNDSLPGAPKVLRSIKAAVVRVVSGGNRRRAVTYFRTLVKYKKVCSKLMKNTTYTILLLVKEEKRGGGTTHMSVETSPHLKSLRLLVAVVGGGSEMAAEARIAARCR